jgi:anti-sigma28 factor (negative regulator of flagellin synthesis)
MTIKNVESPDVSNANLQRTTGSENVSTSTTQQSSTPAALDDSIALSMASRLVKQSETAGDTERLTRILQLKTAIQKNQYSVDPLAVSHALIEAALLGR